MLAKKKRNYTWLPPIQLRKRERKELKSLLSRGQQSVRVVKRAQALQLLAKGRSTVAVGEAIGLAEGTVRRIGWRYLEGGLKSALYERPRPGAERSLNTQQVQQVVALLCGPPPSGRSRWTVRLLTAEASHRRIVKEASRETIRRLLKEHALKPWREKNVVCG